MVIISYKTIREFAQKYPVSVDALNNWYIIMDRSDFSNLMKCVKPLDLLMLWAMTSMFLTSKEITTG